jgi:hypothetical protein
MKDQDIRNSFATEITEATERFTFKKPKEKANPEASSLGCGVKFFYVFFIL